MDWAPYVLLLAGVALSARWWLSERGRLLADASGLLAIQVVIWIFAEELDNGVPWNPFRPLVADPVDGPVFQLVAVLLLYAPMVVALWFVWKARR